MSHQEIEVKNIDHLGLIAGIIDELKIVEKINEMLGNDPREKMSAGQVVKAIILNGLGFLSQPLYLFSKFFESKSTEHLLGEGIKSEDLNDDKIGRTMDKLYSYSNGNIFSVIALEAVKKYSVVTQYSHLDSSSIHVHGDYNQPETKEDAPAENKINITHGYSRDHRPDLKQFMVDLIVSSDGDIPLFFRTGDEKELSSEEMLSEYKQQQSCERGFRFLKDPLFLADSVFVKNPHRVETMAMLMGLCLLVYSIGQRLLRQNLKHTNSQIKNQVGKLTNHPTLRWIFQIFQGIHVLIINSVKQVTNLTEERINILQYFPVSCQKY